MAGSSIKSLAPGIAPTFRKPAVTDGPVTWAMLAEIGRQFAADN
jgi:hypothetical protein